MTITSTIANLTASTTSVNVARIVTSTLVQVGASSDPKTGITTTTWRLPTGDSRYPLQVVLKIQNQGATRRCSATLSTFVKVSDSVTGVDTYYPITCVQAINLPNALVNTADMGTLLDNAFGLLLGTVTAGAPDFKPASNLAFGVPAFS